jgi:hypothetical protein
MVDIAIKNAGAYAVRYGLQLGKRLDLNIQLYGGCVSEQHSVS